MPYLERPRGQVGFSRHQYGRQPSGIPQGYGAPAGGNGEQRIFKVTLPDDPEQASMLSLRYIHDLVRDGREDPIVRRKAFQIVRAARVRERDTTNTIRAIHHWIQRNIRYEYDPSGVEFLTQARVLIDQAERGEAFEDCDSFVLLEHALLNVLGVPTRSVIIAADGRAKNQWSHIFLQAFDNKKKQWVTLDPIMKDKPVGWHPPKYFRKMTVPIKDGPPSFALNGGSPLPPGMTVEFLPSRAERVQLGDFMGGAAGGWHGFAGYGEEFEERPAPTCDWQGEQGPSASWYRGWATHQAKQVMAAHPEVRPQNMPGAQWVDHINAMLASQSGANPFPGTAPERLPYVMAVHELTNIVKNLNYFPAVQAQMQLILDHLKACDAQRTEYAAWYAKEMAPRQLLAKLQGEVRELARMRSEALSYVVPILDSIMPMMAAAEHQMGRLQDRQEFLELVGEIVEWTARVLSAIGPLTGGITEVLAVAIQLGNLAYQMRQMEALATGNAALVLGQVAGQFENADTMIRAITETADTANEKATRIQEIIDGVLATHPEWSPTAAEVLEAEANVQGSTSILPALGVAAAAAALLMAVL